MEVLTMSYVAVIYLCLLGCMIFATDCLSGLSIALDGCPAAVHDMSCPFLQLPQRFHQVHLLDHHRWSHCFLRYVLHLKQLQNTRHKITVINHSYASIILSTMLYSIFPLPHKNKNSRKKLKK